MRSVLCPWLELRLVGDLKFVARDQNLNTFYLKQLMRFASSTCETKERLSMTFTADGKRQRLPLIFYSFLVILK